MIKKISSITAYAVVVLLLAWAAISYLDIISHNMTTCQYWQHNLFTLIF